MAHPYLPILILIVIAALFAAAFVLLSKLLGPKKPNPVKLSSYECGVDPAGTARQRFSVHFYLVAIEFIIFDVEVALLYPWAVGFREQTRLHGIAPFAAAAVFLAILVLGLLYTARRGVLDWSTVKARQEIIARHEQERQEAA